MNRPMLLAAFGLAALLLCVGAMYLMARAARAEQLAGRIRKARGVVPVTGAAAENPSLLHLIARIGSGIARSGLLPRATLAQLEETLLASGFRASNALGLFVGVKMLLVIVLPALAALLLPSLGLSRMSHIVAVGASAILGLLAPDYIISKIRKKYLARVELGLPDALDMLVICAEAGLGLEPAISRVGAEIKHVHPALAEELARTSNELQVIADSRVALANMGGRTGLDCLRRLGSTLIQTMQFGTPLSAALRVLSAELRQETLTKFEERAARLPVLLTMPMILFILPCVFIVVGGPAIIMVSKAMSLKR